MSIPTYEKVSHVYWKRRVCACRSRGPRSGDAAAPARCVTIRDARRVGPELLRGPPARRGRRPARRGRVGRPRRLSPRPDERRLAQPIRADRRRRCRRPSRPRSRRRSRSRSRRSTWSSTPASTRGSARSTSCRSCPSARRRSTTASRSRGRSGRGWRSVSASRSTCTRARRRGPTACASRTCGAAATRRSATRSAIPRADRRPDFGPARTHPRAGAIAVGARPFLIAWNINLESSDVEVAKRIARAVRESGGGLPAVQGNGFMIEELDARPGVDEPARLRDDADVAGVRRGRPAGRRGGRRRSASRS